MNVDKFIGDRKLRKGHDNPKIDLDQLQFFSSMMEENEFRFAKTMPEHPHWYTLKETWSLDLDFRKCVELIRDYGYIEYFYRTPFIRLDVNGHKYWTMSGPDEAILINKATTNTQSDYDSFAAEYDELFANPKYRKEDEEIVDSLPSLVGKRVLDIGSGTGLLLDYRSNEIDPDNYVGIDPSLPMNEVFKSKHPKYADRVIKTKFEDFALGRFDVIVSLFGSPSYIHPNYLCRIPLMLNSSGSYHLLFLGEEYEPISCVKNNVKSSHWRKNHTLLNGVVEEKFDTFIMQSGTR